MDIAFINHALNTLTVLTENIAGFCAENAGISIKEAEDNLYFVRAFFTVEDSFDIYARVYIPEKEINFHAEININVMTGENIIARLADSCMISCLEAEASAPLTEAISVLRDKTERIFRNAPKLADIALRDGLVNEDGRMSAGELDRFRENAFIEGISFEEDREGITAQIYLGCGEMGTVSFDMLADNSVELLGFV